jgi:hypothetical protein
MSNTNKLVFYNKDGYPYNFRLNNGIWTGKLFFEPNSSNIFKTLCIYTLESVDSIEYSNNMNIINKEIYNTEGMNITKSRYKDDIIETIRIVNSNDNFYSKWITGEDIHRKYPVGTVISFINGAGDFSPDKYFSVVRTRKNHIMIITNTSNYAYFMSIGTTLIYDKNTIPDINNYIKITSHDCISIPDRYLDYNTTFGILPNEKISLVGSEYNDGVYTVNNTTYTKTNFLEYDLSNLLSLNNIKIDLELLTERPLLYNGNIRFIQDGADFKIKFLNGRNSNIDIGTKFIFEDINGENLFDSNEYEVKSIMTEENIARTLVEFIVDDYEEDDGTMETIYKAKIPSDIDININDFIEFRVDENYKYFSINDKLIRRVSFIETGNTINTLTLDGEIHNQNSVMYHIIKKLKKNEQNTVIVEPSISNNTYGGDISNVFCLSNTNKITFEQPINKINNDISDVIESINIIISKYSNIFNLNGIDIYQHNNKLYFQGKYTGQNNYFNVNINNNILNGNIDYYNIILDDILQDNESTNISDELSTSFNADIIFNLYDDSQDYGFQITMNSIQYYIPFNDNSGTTSNTLETIKDFVNLYYDIFDKIGLNLSYGTTVSGTTVLNHMYISAYEPNIDIYEFKVKVNKNSSYILNETKNKCMVVTSNRITTDTVNFMDIGYSTGMIISLSGSSYPSNNKEFNIIGINHNYDTNISTIELSYQGPVYSDIVENLKIKSRDYLRRPRESNDIDIYYRFRWQDDSNDSMFLYDVSGENLKPYGNNPDYEYIGPKPLCDGDNLVILNREINKNKNHVKLPYKQQTIFEQLDFKLEKLDDTNISILPKPIETFISYSSNKEGVDNRNLIIERVDNIKYNGQSDGNTIFFELYDNKLSVKGTLSNNVNFLNMGFKTKRYIKMIFEDLSPKQQYIFENYDNYLITDVTERTITFDKNMNSFTTEYKEFEFEILQLPETIGIFNIYGETEIEDERYKSNLKLLGINISEEDVFIFKQSDIKDDNVDYRLLNRKRKEMFDIYPDIYNYIGSYRSILNSIDYFGYNDVQLVEYYKNIDVESPYYRKLKRVVVPDLMDRKIDGWSYDEDMSKRTEYVKTSLFNLTYRITDEEGNNTYLYTLTEVQNKLNGLKNWLRRNIMPANSNIRDITGVSENINKNIISFDSDINVRKHVTYENIDSVNFNYTSTRNFNDSWLVSVRFYTKSGIVPEYFDLKVITYTKDDTGKLYEQQSFNLFKNDLSNFNFVINWNGLDKDNSDQYFYIKTTTYGDNGLSSTVDRMYRLEDGITYYFDEFKNYTLINNNFRYKHFNYVQNNKSVYIIDKEGNIYIIDKDENNEQ